MVVITLYTNINHACCKKNGSDTLRSLRQFVQDNGMELTIKRTDYSLEYRDEAARVSNLPQPFVYNSENGKSVDFNGEYKEIL